MLCYLRLKNYLLIPEIELNFKDGFTCFTGETGAGKSMILGSIELLKGERVDWKIFEGQKEVIIEGIFRLKPDKEILNKYDLQIEDEIFIQRVLDPEQKISKIRINGIPVSASILKEIFEKYIEIHGQHSQVYLLSKDNQIDILDAFAGLSKKLKDFKDLFRNYKKMKKEYDELKRNYERILSMKDFMEHSIKEMEEINIENIDTESLFDEYRKLYSKKELKEKINEIMFELSEGEESIVNKLNKILKYENLFKEFNLQPFNMVSDALNILQEAESEFVKMRFEEEEDEKKLENLQNLLQKIEELKRKHRTDEKGLLFLYKKWKEELESFEKLFDKLKDTEIMLNEIENKLKNMAEEISFLRKTKAEELKYKLVEELHKLGFSYVKFEIEFSEREIYEKGKDEVNFLISTSKDRKLFLLSKVASGGELSRIMLALKTLITKEDEKRIMIFDEVDVGIGGEVARIVGKNLKKLSKGKQVFCVTHLPQIACFADHHYFVYKEETRYRTIVKVKELKSESEREREIARMIAGEKVDENSLKAARTLLKEGIKI